MLVQNKGNYSYTANGLTFNPGTNNVEDQDFERFLEHPLMQYLDDRGEFVYTKEKSGPTAKEIIAMIEDSYDIEMLNKLKEEEDRKTVLSAIEKRLEELQNPAQ